MLWILELSCSDILLIGPNLILVLLKLQGLELNEPGSGRGRARLDGALPATP